MLVSNNVRAMQTAAYLDLPNANWYMDYNLRERDGGLFDSLKPSKRDKKYHDEQMFHDSQPFFFQPLQGESITAVCLRIKIVLDTIARECDGKNVIILCHGHVMRVFRIILEKPSLRETNDLLLGKNANEKVPNCSIIHYTRENPYNREQGLADRFNWVRMIRPAGGGAPEDDWSLIMRKRYTNDELLEEAKFNRYGK